MRTVHEITEVKIKAGVKIQRQDGVWCKVRNQLRAPVVEQSKGVFTVKIKDTAYKVNFKDVEHTVHLFEQARLGKAPFRVTNVYECKYQAAPGAPAQPGTTCDYCGTGIMQVFEITDSEGKKFKVGSDCVVKTGDAGLRRIVTQQERLKREAKRRAKEEKDLARVSEIAKSLPLVAEALSAEPHPNGYFASQGKTLLDYVQYMLTQGSVSGKLTGACIIERYLTK